MKQNLAPIAAAAFALATCYPLAAMASHWVGDHNPAPLAHITKSAAKNRIVNDNYTNITDLTRVPKGWTAQAEEQGKPVKLMVNNLGIVDIQQS